MKVGKVIGSMVSTRKHEQLVGNRFLVIQLLKSENKIVAVDSVGAGIGEYVLMTTGSSARLACNRPDTPIDAVIIGILDESNDFTLFDN